MTFDPFFTQVIEQKDIDKVEKRTRVFSEMMGKGKQVAKFEWDEISFIKLLGQGGFCTVTKVRIGDQRQQENRRKNQNRSTISHEQQRRWSRRRAPPTRSPLPSTQQEEENGPKKEGLKEFAGVSKARFLKKYNLMEKKNTTRTKIMVYARIAWLRAARRSLSVR